MKDKSLIQIFISYSHADKHWLKRLLIHLKALRLLSNDFDYVPWSDLRIRPGTRWRDEIKAAIERADVAILLVSADFLASDFIQADELPPLLRAAEDRGTQILPLIISASLVNRVTELAQIQAVNDLATPLVAQSKAEQESTLVRLVEAILDYARTERLSSAPIDRPAQIAEDFLSPAVWPQLSKIGGNWILDGEKPSIIGSGMHGYLLSQFEYGDTDFLLEATLQFSNFRKPMPKSLGMNAGILLGWKFESTPRYYNVLLTGSSVQIERLGASGGKVTQDVEKLGTPVDLDFVQSTPIAFRIHVNSNYLIVYADESELIKIDRPPGIVGRVGLRPWRSVMTCLKFNVKQIGQPVDGST